MTQSKIPPKSKTRYYRDFILQRFGADYTVRVRQIGEIDRYQVYLGVMTQLVSDCKEDGIDIHELLEHAIEIPQTDMTDELGYETDPGS